MDQSVEYAIESIRPWAPWVSVLLLLFAAATVFVVYVMERGGFSPSRLLPRLLLASIRLSLIALILFMLYGWLRRPYETDRPEVALVLDTSQSMDFHDQYPSPRHEKIAEKLAKNGGSDASRINLAKALLLGSNSQLLAKLQQRYRTKVYFVGNTAETETAKDEALIEKIQQLSANQSSSRLGKGLREVLELHRGRPTAAVVMFTDGVVTEGAALSEIASAAMRKGAPLFFVGLGSSRPPRDVHLGDLLVEDVVFVDDLLRFDFRLSGPGFGGKSVELTVKQVGDPRVLDQKTVTIDEQGASQTQTLEHRPAHTGDFEYVIEAKPLEGETNTNNNRLSRLVSVRDQTIRVLLVQEYPNGDFRFLKNLLGRGLKKSELHTDSQEDSTEDSKQDAKRNAKSIALTVVLQEADQRYAQQDEHATTVFPISRDELFDYDVVLFGDVDPSRLSPLEMQNLADFVIERGGGVVFTAGPRHTPLGYRDTPLSPLFPMPLDSTTAPPLDDPILRSFQPRLTRLGRAAPHMQLAAASAESVQVWSALPGAYWLLEAPVLKLGAQVLAEHSTQSGSDGRRLPVISLQFVGAGKVVFHFTDDLWRWRYRIGDAFFARYWIQTIRYLSRSQVFGAGRKAKLTTDQPLYRRPSPVRLEVVFADDRQAPAGVVAGGPGGVVASGPGGVVAGGPGSQDGVTVVVQRSGGQTRFVKLRRRSTHRGIFEAAVTDLPEGQYRAWLSTPALKGEPAATTFRIESAPTETARLQMDVEEMKAAAKISGGGYYEFENAERLLQELPSGQSVRIKPRPPQPLWNSWILAAAFAGLITVEWLLRRRIGLL